jgi:hypothetical protein
LGGKDQPAAAAPPCALSQSAKVVPSANFHAVRPLMLAPTTIAELLPLHIFNKTTNFLQCFYKVSRFPKGGYVVSACPETPETRA